MRDCKHAEFHKGKGGDLNLEMPTHSHAAHIFPITDKMRKKQELQELLIHSVTIVQSSKW